MNINLKQAVSIIMVVLGVMIASTSQLTDLVGPSATKIIVSISSLLMSVLSGILAVITGQSTMVKDVQAMPGVEKIVVNEKANPALASLAVDPANLKIEAKPGTENAVESTAKNA